MPRIKNRVLSFCLIVGCGAYTLNTAHAGHVVKTSSKTRTIKSKKLNQRKSRVHRIHSYDSVRKYNLRRDNIAYQPDGSWQQSGTASWYGGRHQSRNTGSGEVYDMNRLTAAHPSLPLGTKVMVRSEDTGDSVIVTINDRGPFTHNRVIDLSKAAAEKIGMLRSGVAHVTITPVNGESTEVAEAPEG
ncbi:MAG: septal ring lytic transglycosylase RlpA family protein [Commensalibacter sp.]